MMMIIIIIIIIIIIGGERLMIVPTLQSKEIVVGLIRIQTLGYNKVINRKSKSLKFHYKDFLTKTCIFTIFQAFYL